MTQAARESEALAVFGIDAGSADPPFRQIHDAVVGAVSDGRLLPGQKLPTIRALAAHLGVAVNTAAGAYRALEADGVVEGRGRAGTFIALGGDPVGSAARRVALEAAARLRELGLDAAAARAALDAAVGATYA
ncbi:GntR family transcriptional regulator [Leucobacter zeae]|nr:GntR family transcriptional regulator [Leucobacter zeae]